MIGKLFGFGIAALLFGTIVSLVREKLDPDHILLTAAIIGWAVIMIIGLKNALQRKRVDDVS